MSAAVISACDVSREYVDLGGAPVRAVTSVSLDVGQGELVAIVGPSGSGKSTLLHLLGGLDRPTSGHIRVAGADLGDASERQLTTFRRDHIGFVFQALHLVPTLSIVENVALSAIVSGRRRSDWMDRALEVVSILGLGDHLDRPQNVLSGGERQRVAVGRAIFSRPDVLLADEPTGALDSSNSKVVLELIRSAVDAGESACGVVVTHDVEVAAFADRVVAVHDGRIRDQLALSPRPRVTTTGEERDRASSIREWMATASV